MKNAEGKNFNSKFRMRRYDAAHAEDGKGPGPRAQAHEIEGMPHEKEEQMEEQVHPGIHDEIKQIAAEHGPAHEIHMMHDHGAKMSHVHSVHEDGHEHHAEHKGEMHVHHAHMHAAHAAGHDIEQGEYPEEHEPEPGGESEEEFQAEPL